MENFSDLTVLVVEDNAINMTIALKALHKLGILARSAQNGIEALSLVEKNRFDLILMDCHMPELDGFETTLRLRAEYPLARKTRIVALTANARDDAKRRCADVGMDDFITKPLSFENLMIKISAHLREIQNEPKVS